MKLPGLDWLIKGDDSDTTYLSEYHIKDRDVVRSTRMRAKQM